MFLCGFDHRNVKLNTFQLNEWVLYLYLYYYVEWSLQTFNQRRRVASQSFFKLSLVLELGPEAIHWPRKYHFIIQLVPLSHSPWEERLTVGACWVITWGYFVALWIFCHIFSNHVIVHIIFKLFSFGDVPFFPVFFKISVTGDGLNWSFGNLEVQEAKFGVLYELLA